MNYLAITDSLDWLLNQVASGAYWLADRIDQVGWHLGLDLQAHQAVAMLPVALGVLLFVALFFGSGKRRRRRGNWKQGYRKTRRGRFSYHRKFTSIRHRQWRRQARHFLKTCQKRPLSKERLAGFLGTMNPYVFEYLLIEAYRAQRYDTRKIQKASGDGGIDGMVHTHGRWHLVQAKRYRHPVSPAIVSDFASVCARKNMPGLFITTSSYSARVRQLAAQCRPRVHLLDLDDIHRLLRFA